MSPHYDKYRCAEAERVALLAIGSLPPDELREMEAHIASCSQCRREWEALREVAESFVSWPTDVVRPMAPLWERLAERIGADTRGPPPLAQFRPRLEPEWDEVAPGISCKLLATDTDLGRVSMLVRLGPGIDYPAHLHAGTEELHLLDGELWINDRKLQPGDYNRAEPGTRDQRVWSETGCTCVLITSFRDVLG
jgi:anti-sigma factor ChrR (cupin superfamily)